MVFLFLGLTRKEKKAKKGAKEKQQKNESEIEGKTFQTEEEKVKFKEEKIPSRIQKNSPEGLLGSGLIEFNAVKILKKNPSNSISFTRENELAYIIDFPVISSEEAWVCKQVLNEFRKKSDAEKNLFSVEKCLEFFLEEKLLSISKEQKNYLTELIGMHVFKNGLMQFLLDDPALEEIALIGVSKNNPVYVFHRIFGWLKSNLFYSSEIEVINLINRLARKTGRQISFQQPQINAVLDNGNRLNASISPVAFTGPALTIRKFPQKPLTPFDLVNSKTCSAELMAFLDFAMKTDSSILFCGNTGSGKTTFLNACFLFVPEKERIIVIEETPEINIPHRHLVKLNTVEGLGIEMNSLIVNSLRMRPDRVIVGEVRKKEEINSFIDTILAGQGRGSYATFHAQNAKEALNRLESSGVRKEDLNAIDLIVVLRRIACAKINSMNSNSSGSGISEKRRVTEVAELDAQNNIRVLFSYDYSKDALIKCGESSRMKKKILETFNCSEKELAKAMEEKTNEFMQGLH